MSIEHTILKELGRPTMDIDHADPRLASWFTTASGQMFFPWSPEPSKINLTDIAHALSQLNRWGGHTRLPYSVAQHSVLVARRLAGRGTGSLGFGSMRLASYGLLHDSTEAYMGGDIVSPIKRHVPELMALERGIANAITERFGLPLGALEDPEVKQADLDMLAWEYNDLMVPSVDHNGIPIPRPPIFCRSIPDTTLIPWPPRVAEASFLEEARLLGLR